MGDSEEIEMISKRGGTNKKGKHHSKKHPSSPQRNVMEELSGDIEMDDNQPSVNHSSQQDDEPIEQFGDVRDDQANSKNSQS